MIDLLIGMGSSLLESGAKVGDSPVGPMKIIKSFFMSQVVWDCNLNGWYTPSKTKYRHETDSIQVP
jgi:hypothetical protein